MVRRLLPPTVGLLAAGLVFGLGATLSGGGGADPGAPAPMSLADGRSVFARMGCGGCHTFAAANAAGRFGPNLDAALVGYDRSSLAQQIIDPVTSSGFAAMPTTFGERLSPEELTALVGFLLEERRP